jgi:hypothetical protein
MIKRTRNLWLVILAVAVIILVLYLKGNRNRCILDSNGNPLLCKSPKAYLEPGRVLVVFKPDVDDAQITSVIKSTGGRRLYQVLMPYIWKLEVPIGTEQKVIRLLRNSPLVQHAESGFSEPIR